MPRCAWPARRLPPPPASARRPQPNAARSRRPVREETAAESGPTPQELRGEQAREGTGGNGREREGGRLSDSQNIAMHRGPAAVDHRSAH
eukprot:2599937-Rhodomonas_salina.1